MKSNFERILLIKPSALGDVILTIPLLVELRSWFPAARLDWMLTPENAKLLQHHPAISNIVFFERNKLSKAGISWKNASELLSLFSQIRQPKYDLVIDMHGQFRSALFALASGAPTRIGFDRPSRNLRWSTGPHAKYDSNRGWMGAREGSWMAYTHRIPLHTLDVHAVDRYLWVSKVLGRQVTGPPNFTIHLSPKNRSFVDDLIVSHNLNNKPLVLLVPNTIWETKRWHPNRFAEVGQHFQQKGYCIAMAGTKGDLNLCQEIATMCPQAVNLAGQTNTAELAALIEKAAIAITNDSGSMHLAVAMGTPVVSVFGPTNPVCIGPYGREEAVVRRDLPCSPCNFRKLSQCQYGHACLSQLSSQIVIERVEKILAAAKK